MQQRPDDLRAEGAKRSDGAVVLPRAFIEKGPAGCFRG